MKGGEIMISVLTYDMLNMADVKAILKVNGNGYIHIEPKIKKISIIDLGMEEKDIIPLSNFNFSVNLFGLNFKLNHLLASNSHAYILWGGNNKLQNIDCLLEKVKALVGKKPLIGVGLGKEVLETVIKDLGEDDWQNYKGIKKHCKYKIYCLDNMDLEKIDEII